MLAIRMQRIGRKGQAQFRVIVQDSRWSPKSGKFVAMLGSYDPHTKVANLEKDKAQTFLNNGAQPSYRVADLLKSEGVKLPAWVAKKPKKSGKVKNPDKLAKNEATPKPEPAEATADTEAEQPEQTAEEQPKAEVTEQSDEPPAELEAKAEPAEESEAKTEPTEESAETKEA